jgi:hypothetical protein
MLNQYRGPEDRKKSLLEVFDPSMFTVNHPAWETPPGTAIDLPALTSDIAARVERNSDFAGVARSEIRQFREHADTYDDAELMDLATIAMAGLADSGRIFRDREDVLRYLALNASTEMEDLWATDDAAWVNALFATSSSRTWLNAARNNCWRGRARPDCGKRISAATRTTRCAVLRSTCGAYSCTTVHVTWRSARDARQDLNHGQSCLVNSTERRSLGTVARMLNERGTVDGSLDGQISSRK